MENLDTYLEQFKQQQSELDEINGHIQNNNVEVQFLEMRLNDVNGRYQENQNVLQNANKNIAFGKLSTEEHQALKNESEELDKELNMLQESIQTRKEAGTLLNEKVIGGRQALNSLKTTIAEKLSEQFFNEMAGNETLKKLVYAFFACQDHRRFNGTQDQVYLHQFFGQELLKKVFINQDPSSIAIPHIHEARNKIDEMIAELV